MGYSPLLLLARGLLVVIIIRPVLTFLVPRSTLGWLQDMLLRFEIVLARLYSRAHLPVSRLYCSPTLFNRPPSPHQHWPTSFIHPCSHAQATTLHGASVFMFSSSLSYDIETRDLWPWNHIRALRIGISSLLLHHLIWYHVATITSRSDTRGISSPTVQVVERLDGCDPYFRRSITPTLRFKCQDIIRFPILPTKHNPQALRTGGEIHQYFFGWIDTSRIDVVGRGILA